MGDEFGGVRTLFEGAVGAVFPSAQLAVVDQGETRLLLSAGDCDQETRFDLASLTKPLCTTTLVMRLCESGALSLDTELRPGVTVRLALCHAAGLPPWRPFFESLRGARDPKAAVIAAARREPLDSAPGTRSVYSDLGFILLGDAVERAGRAPLDAQWSAMNLCEATFHPDPAACAPTEGGAEGTLRGRVHDDNARFMSAGGPAGHAGLFGSATAVSHAAAELCATWHGERNRLVEPTTLRAFWSPAGIPHSTWCLGWDRPAPVELGTSSAGSRWPRDGVGHLGFTGCSLWIDPPRRRWVVLLSNRVYPSRENDLIKTFRPALHDAVIAALDGAPDMH